MLLEKKKDVSLQSVFEGREVRLKKREKSSKKEMKQ